MALVPEFINLLRDIRDRIYPETVQARDDIQPVIDDIDNVNIVAEYIKTGGGGTGGGGQFLGSSTVGSVMFTKQSTNENLVLLSGTNGLIVDSLTIEDGGSITIEDGAVLKIV